jgi:hypothetical protein
MLRTVMRTGSDPTGSPHPVLDSVLQPLPTEGPAEGVATIMSYTITSGLAISPYTLRKPNYAFQGVTPLYFSARCAP